MKKLFLLGCWSLLLFSLAGAMNTRVHAQVTDPVFSQPVKDEDLDKFDPLKIGGSEDVNKTEEAVGIDGKVVDFSDPGKVLSLFLTYFAFPAAGLILFVMIVWGGFEILSGAATAKSKEAGQQRVTAAVIGFILLFASYWIAQILEVVFNINILG